MTWIKLGGIWMRYCSPPVGNDCQPTSTPKAAIAIHSICPYIKTSPIQNVQTENAPRSSIAPHCTKKVGIA